MDNLADAESLTAVEKENEEEEVVRDTFRIYFQELDIRLKILYHSRMKMNKNEEVERVRMRVMTSTRIWL